MKAKRKFANKLILAITTLVIVLLFSTYYLNTSTQIDRPPDITLPNQQDPQPNPENDLDRLLSKLIHASVSFNSPDQMNISDSHQIQLFLSPSDSIEQLKQSITEEGEKIGDSIKVSDNMEARLTGYRFNITAITPETQAISNKQQTEWKWEISPTAEGKHNLHLTLTALLDINGQTSKRSIRTFSRIITVEVTATQKILGFIKGNWQWLWAAILLPIGGLVWKRWKKLKII